MLTHRPRSTDIRPACRDLLRCATKLADNPAFDPNFRRPAGPASIGELPRTAHERRQHHERATDRGCDLPRGVPPCLRHADPAARRFRYSRKKPCTMHSARRSNNGRATACRRNPRAWLVSAGRFKAIDGIRRRARFDSLDEHAPSRSRPSPMNAARTMKARGRPTAADLHLLPSCHCPRTPRSALTLREVCGLTTEEIARAFLTPAAHPRAAHRSRQGQDPRCGHSLPGAGAAGTARAARSGAARHLPRIQRRLFRLVRRIADAARSVGRSDPPRPAAGRVAAASRRYWDCWR